MTTPAPVPGAPWWANVLLTVLSIGLAAWVSNRPARRDARASRELAATAAEQATVAAAHAAVAAAETSPNHGGSLKDSSTRTEGGVRDLQVSVAAIARDIGGLRAEIRTERDERRDVAKRVDDVAGRVDDVATRVDDVGTRLTQHVTDCPSRA
ncbi:DUF2746 domain-containing protein [Cellulomonas oligotrophica]|uniref:DUF2746 domain-containing protein n=1 Tax=Cellulomonas oligotrophica TaxID=931536 RepID=A0A7Y9K0E0_9CELL|nr:DUF2746 domain-containing protein [Cellulomonas oligotrophica]NYD87769.1 hypothetical protein [Cellulomonas oligotrophica]GIG33026.1 hypothetical protein Col01nite_21850 [Cellulomonas oligotrophica]